MLFIAFSNAETRFDSIIKPVTPSSKISGTPPTFVATTGTPTEYASITMPGYPSIYDGSNSTSYFLAHQLPLVDSADLYTYSSTLATLLL